jgi:NitT/TauT family transport system permease protein
MTTLSTENARREVGSPEAARPTSRRRRAPNWLLSTVAILAGIGVFWVASFFTIIPSPPEVIAKGISLASAGTLVVDIGASLTRVLIGFAIGTALAVPVGFVMGWYATARSLLDPWIQFLRMIPPLAILPLSIVVLGTGEVARIFVIFMASFLACVVATFQGVVSVDRTLINAARVLGAGDGVIFRRVVVPASSPFLFVGMRVGLGSSWATLVASELIAAQQGLGFRMQQAQLYFDLPTIFVSIIFIGLLGFAMDRLLMLTERKVTSWQERR